MPLNRALGWLARNVRDAGMPDAVPIELERNREAAVELGAQNPPDMPLYQFRLGLRAGFSGEQRASIPVLRKVNPHPHPILKEIFYCEVAGTVLEAANVHALRQKVARMLETLAPAESLPLAYFTVPTMDYSLPVYEDGGEIVCPVIAGPKLKAPDLAAMRRHVLRYLVGAGYVTDQSQVEVRVLRPSDLKLVPPAAVVRSLTDPEIWFATVEGRSPEGLVIGLLGESAELRPEERPRAGVQASSAPPAGADITSLLRLLGGDLVDARRLEDPFDLYAERVRPEIWARTEQLTDDVGRKLTCWLESEEPTRLELPLRRTAAGELLTALEDRGICVFIAGEEPVLARKLGSYLSGHGFLRFQEAVEVVAEQVGTGPERGLAPESKPRGTTGLPAGEQAEDAVGGRAERITSSGEIEFRRLEFGSAPGEPAGSTREEEVPGKRKQEEEVVLP
jgi:hypothetical protein